MTSSPTSRVRLAVLAAVAAVALLPAAASATWSVIALDMRTGRLVVASATCVPQGRLLNFPAEGLMDVQAIVVPGVGVAASWRGWPGPGPRRPVRASPRSCRATG